MNKTTILSFILDKVALKARNVSINMRKRIHWMLKYTEITVKEYDKKALVLNGWIRVGIRGVEISKVEDIRKGVSNYFLETQEQLDKLMTLNKEVRCHELYFNPTAPLEVESIEYLTIDQDNYNAFPKYSINAIKTLVLKKLSTDQIKFILTRFKRINKLMIYNSSLKSIDLSKSRIKEFQFDLVSFQESVYLPREIDQLEFSDCKSQNLIKAQRVNRIDFLNQSVDLKEYIELVETLKGVKIIGISYLFAEYLTSLPSTVRKIFIDRPWLKIDNLQGITDNFPYLIEIGSSFPIETANQTRLRVINPIMKETQEKFSLRPRKITGSPNNALQLNTHPELFEKVEWVCIQSNKFNFDLLPSKIKRIHIWNEVNEESVTLNRLEKERE